MVQVINDHFGLIHPDRFSAFFDAQARHFDLAAFVEQRLAIKLIVLRIAQRDRNVEAVQGAAGLYAERAGMKLIQRQVPSCFSNSGLSLGVAFFLLGRVKKSMPITSWPRPTLNAFMNTVIPLACRAKASRALSVLQSTLTQAGRVT
ncbi:hypothetical protein A250_16888 [Pseudomonas syringae pv. actinidiae ICMP 9617]|nr:hypothetical protein A250_16888 [Pseudomonas syringae pv. actinidiae ICMP 9617]